VSPGWPNGTGADPEQFGRARTPWGTVLVRWRSGSLLASHFEDDGPATGMVTPAGGSPDHRRAQAWFDQWLDGDSSLPKGVALSPVGSDFQRRVWGLLGSIPRGRTVSYGWVANALGVPRGVRAVGAACGANPVALWIPCHRVVAGDGSLRGYRWGLHRKAALLAWESRIPMGG
jgi:O-6-methylguanine DNA methyltransferase